MDPSSEYLAVIGEIEEVMRSQKFQGAAANIFNATIISRDLGLVERTNVEVDERRKVAEVFPKKLSND